MRVALYVRVSTERQQQAQTIEQQLVQLREYVAGQDDWALAEEHVFVDDGYSGAKLNRPGLDALRDQAARAAFELVLITAPDRLARKYVHQMIVLEELERQGCRVVFIDRPLSDDPHEQLVVQIRGAVAEYERTLIADRMRRGRQAKLRSGQLLPWSRPPYGYRLDPERPRDPAGVRAEPVEAAIVQELFGAYAAGGATLFALAQRLTARRLPSPTGRARWSVSTVRGLLTNPAYTGLAANGRRRATAARGRWSALRSLGPGQSSRPAPREEWITVPVPAIVEPEQFEQVQRRLATNQQGARRSTKHAYLLRGLVSCGVCQLACTGRARRPDETRYTYYVCRGKAQPIGSHREERCPARFIPAGQLDQLVWADLGDVLQHPELVARALERAQAGAWLPEELQRRQAALRKVRAGLERQRERLLEAYLAEAIELATFERKDADLRRQRDDLDAQDREITAQGQRLAELSEIARSTTAVCDRLRGGLERATFEQQRQLVELLIDRVVVTNGAVEIRYVIPTTDNSAHTRFCHLRTDYFQIEAANVGPPEEVQVRCARPVAPQPEDLGLVGPPGQAADLHTHQRAAHDRSGPAGPAGRMGLLFRMQAGPGLDADPPVLLVLRGVLRGRGRPGARGLAVELRAMSARPARRAGFGGVGVGVEAAIGTEPDQDGDRHLGQSQAHCDRVVAGVEDEQREAAPTRPPPDQSRDLRDRDGVGVLGWVDPPDIQWGGPAIPSETELDQPLVGPAGHDRLAGRVARWVVVVATLGAGLGVAARPDAHVDRVDWLTVGQRMLGQQHPQGLDVDPPVGQGAVDAAPATLVPEGQAQVGQRRDRPGRQHGIDELEQRVFATQEAVMPLVPNEWEALEGTDRIGVHHGAPACQNGPRPAKLPAAAPSRG